MTDKSSTEDLIRVLAASAAPARFNPVAALGGMAGLLVAGLGLFFAGFGLRADLAPAWAHLAVQAKTVLPVLMSAAAIWLALRSSRPAERVGLWPLAIPVALALVLAALRLSRTDSPVLAEIAGQTALACLGSIVLLAALPLVAGIALFRQTAPTRPILTGALLGTAVGAGAAAGYALHCIEDSPLFFVAWYGLAIALTAGLGAWLGHRFLRW